MPAADFATAAGAAAAADDHDDVAGGCHVSRVSERGSVCLVSSTGPMQLELAIPAPCTHHLSSYGLKDRSG